MSEDEHKEGEEPVAVEGALPDLDAAFEDDDAPLLDDEGVVIGDEYADDDLAADFIEEDKDGNY